MDDLDDEESDKVMGHLRAMADYIKRETGARTVQIHVTKDAADGGCCRYAQGTGNIYERIGASQDWLNSL